MLHAILFKNVLIALLALFNYSSLHNTSIMFCKPPYSNIFLSCVRASLQSTLTITL